MQTKSLIPKCYFYIALNDERLPVIKISHWNMRCTLDKLYFFIKPVIVATGFNKDLSIKLQIISIAAMRQCTFLWLSVKYENGK